MKHKTDLDKKIIRYKKLQAEIKALYSEIQDEVKNQPNHEYKSDYTHATYQISYSDRFSKDMFMHKYSKEEYDQCKVTTVSERLDLKVL